MPELLPVLPEPELPELLVPPPQPEEPLVPVPVPVPDMPPAVPPAPVLPALLLLPVALLPSVPVVPLSLPPPRMELHADRPNANASKPVNNTLWCCRFMFNSFMETVSGKCVTMPRATRVRGMFGIRVPADSG